MTACSPAPALGSVSPTATISTSAEQLAAAWAARDRAAFVATFGRSPLAAAQAERWYQLLTDSHGRLTVTDSGQLAVTNQLPGDRRPATEIVSLRLSADNGFTVVAEAGTPLWALEPARLAGSGSTSVLTAAGDDQATAWLALATRAEAAVRAAGIAEDWPGGLVLEVPESADDFALRTGSPAATASAVTSCRSGTPRIIVNPALREYPDHVQFATLTHEAVHAATDSACQSGLAWAVEGLAESVAAQADPATATANRTLVRAYLASHPLPAALPEHPRTPTDYALAQLAADQVRSRLADRAPDFFARATRDALSPSEIARATSWYRDALRDLVR